MMSKILKLGPTFFVGLLLAVITGLGAPAQALQTAASDSVSSVAPKYEYRLGSGDKLKITVFGEPDLTGDFTVAGDGKVSYPLIGNVEALGLTETELASAITAALKQGYVNDPKVNVEVETFRPFFILGEVNKPGQYDFANGMTVERAVAIASGYTYRADKKKVYIKHVNDEKETAVPLTSQVMLQPGDTIRIGERYF